MPHATRCRKILTNCESGLRPPQSAGSLICCSTTSWASSATPCWRTRSRHRGGRTFLGRNGDIDIPLMTTWLGTGNNVSITHDMSERLCYARLETPYEQPAQRSGIEVPQVARPRQKASP